MDQKIFLATRVAGQLAIVIFIAAVIYLGSSRLIEQINSVAGSLAMSAAQPAPQRIAAYLTPLDRATLEGVPVECDATGVQTDLTIDGKGFFQVKLPDSIGGGIGYTRQGKMMFSINGDLVVGIGPGYKLVPTINIPAGVTKVEISPQGSVQYTAKNQAVRVAAGQIQLAYFNTQQALRPLGSGIFEETDESGSSIIINPGEQGAGKLVPGFLQSDCIYPVKKIVASLNQN